MSSSGCTHRPRRSRCSCPGFSLCPGQAGTCWVGRTPRAENHQNSVPAAQEAMQEPRASPSLQDAAGPVCPSRCPFPLPGLCQDQCKASSLLLCSAASQHVEMAGSSPVPRVTPDSSLSPEEEEEGGSVLPYAEDSGTMHCFGFATWVLGGSVGTSPPWICLALASRERERGKQVSCSCSGGGCSDL